MIIWNNKEPVSIWWQGKKIIQIRIANKEVWNEIMSCFGGGFWVNEKPWLTTEAWKN